MEIFQSLNFEQTDEPLSTLANRNCRFVRSYFRGASEDSASIDDLAAAVTRRDAADRNRTAIQLHHSTLPKLEEAGIVEYDVRTKTVHYHASGSELGNRSGEVGE